MCRSLHLRFCLQTGRNRVINTKETRLISLSTYFLDYNYNKYSISSHSKPAAPNGLEMKPVLVESRVKAIEGSFAPFTLSTGLSE